MSLQDNARPFDTPLQLGLFSYPVLQAADILVHRATHVPVGEDQSQHLEFARNCAAGFNSSYSKILVEPETVLCTFHQKRNFCIIIDESQHPLNV
jgi:tryptophanyl-tRNA synthetase